MSAENNLSAALFHGTYVANMRRGSHIKPASELDSTTRMMTGGSNYTISSSTHVAVTTDPEHAKFYARTAHSRVSKIMKDSGLHFAGVPTVYQVEPLGVVSDDPHEEEFNDVTGKHKQIAGRAKVLRTNWKENMEGYLPR